MAQIWVRKGYNSTAHRAEQSGTWGGMPLFESTLCGRKIKICDGWREIHDGTGWSRVIGHGPGFLAQPCARCDAKNA